MSFFVEGLKDKEPYVRASTSKAIGNLFERVQTDSSKKLNLSLPEHQAGAFQVLLKLVFHDTDSVVLAESAVAIKYVYPNTQEGERGFRQLAKRFGKKDESALDALLCILLSESIDEKVKQSVGATLKLTRSGALVDRLESVLQSEFDKANKSGTLFPLIYVGDSIRAMRYISNRRIEDILIKLLAHKDHPCNILKGSSIPWAACESLGVMRSRRAISSLIKLLDDDNLGNCAAWALGYIGSRKAIGPLIKSLREACAKRHNEERKEKDSIFLHQGASDFECVIIEALGRIGDARSLKYLQHYLSDLSSPSFLDNVRTRNFAGYDGIETVNDLAKLAIASIESRKITKRPNS